MFADCIIYGGLVVLAFLIGKFFRDVAIPTIAGRYVLDRLSGKPRSEKTECILKLGGCNLELTDEKVTDALGPQEER